MHRSWALVVAPDGSERDALEADLGAAGYGVMSFADCDSALAWIAEETPQAAVLRAQGDPMLPDLFHELLERGVATVAGVVLVAHHPSTTHSVGCPARADREAIAADHRFAAGPPPRTMW